MRNSTSRVRVLLLAISMTATVSAGRSYHFDAVGGSDARSATEAASASTPWKSLSKVSSVTLKPGDEILLKAGSVWRERLRIVNSGEPGNPIRIAAYGSGAMPEIRGTTKVTGTLVSGIRIAKITSGLPVKGVFRDTVPLRVARLPADTGWFFGTRGATDSSIYSPRLVGSDWTGASIHLRTTPWTLETHEVVATKSGELLLSDKPVYALDSSYFFVSNHPSALKSPGTWTYVASDSTLRWIEPTGTTLATVEAAVLDTGIDVSKSNYVTISGIKVFGTTTLGIHGNGSAGIKVENCRVWNPGLVAIRLSGRNNHVIGNQVVGPTSAGIINHGVGNRTVDNRVREVAVLTKLGPGGNGPGCCNGHGIAVSGDTSYVARNDIDSVGYNGITFTGRHSIVEENTIGNYCITTEDGGGVYTIAGSPTAAGATGSVIRRNVIKPTTGAQSGRSSPGREYAGIALDNNSHDVRIDSNVVYGSARGIGCHLPRRVTAKGNVLFDNLSAQIDFYLNSSITDEDIRTNLFSDNILVSFQGQVIFKTAANRFATAYERLQGNYQCDEMKTLVRCSRNGKPIWQHQRVSSTDPGLGQNVLNATSSTTWTTNGTLKPDTVSTQHADFPLQMATGSPAAATSSSTSRFGISSGQWWKLSFTASGSSINQPLGPVLQSAKGAIRLAELPVLRLDTTPSRFDLLFQTTGSDANAMLQLTTGSGFPAYWFGDVSMRTIQESLVEKTPTAQIFVNATPTSTNRYLGGSPWNLASGTAVNSVNIPGFGAVVAFPIDKITADSPIAPPTPKKGFQRVYRKQQEWVIENLSGRGRIFDLRGRMITEIVPNAAGNGTWSQTSPGPFYLVVDGNVIGLAAPD